MSNCCTATRLGLRQRTRLRCDSHRRRHRRPPLRAHAIPERLHARGSRFAVRHVRQRQAARRTRAGAGHRVRRDRARVQRSSAVAERVAIVGPRGIACRHRDDRTGAGVRHRPRLSDDLVESRAPPPRGWPADSRGSRIDQRHGRRPDEQSDHAGRRSAGRRDLLRLAQGPGLAAPRIEEAGARRRRIRKPSA